MTTTTGSLSIVYGIPTHDPDAAFPIDIVGERMDLKQEVLRFGQPTTLEVTPGHYQVRGYLPSSELLLAQVQVEAGRTSSVVLQPHRPSPRESLTWAYSIKQADLLSIHRVEGSETLPPDLQPSLKPTFALWRQSVQHPGSWEANVDVSRLVTSDASIQDADANALSALTIALPNASEKVDNRYWLQVTGPPAFVRFVALPISPPWQHAVRILVVRTALPWSAFTPPDKWARDPVGVLVNTGNARAQMLLAFLGTGAFDAARRVGAGVVDQAEQMLKEKRDDPCSAAIAGYYLLQAGQLARLHDWTGNLAEWFPWMSDGAVIHAWHLMRQRSLDIGLARQRFLDAEQRGLPIFTSGLRLLFDGIDFLYHKSPDDVDVGKARARLQPYARAANWHALTTSFYAREPSAPELPSGLQG